MGAADGGYVQTNGSKGTMTTYVGTSANRDAGLVHVNDATGGVVAELGSAGDGGIASVYNTDRKVVVAIAASKGLRTGIVQVNRADGTVGTEISERAEGSALSMKNAAGVDVAWLGASSNMQHGLLVLDRKDGKRTVELGSDEFGGQLLLGAGTPTNHVALFARATGGQLELRTPSGGDGVLAGIGDDGGGVNLFDTKGTRTVVQSH